MKIAIATDAWHPQVNGVVRTLAATVAILESAGHDVEMITPDRFLTVPMPGYSAIRLALAPRFGLRRMLDSYRPDIVHISTEGPIGWAARSWCLARKVPFTTAFHTRFPDYAAVRTGINAERFWPIMRRFHAPSRAVLVATASLDAELRARGFSNTRPWTRGIDHATFRADGEDHPALRHLPRPILLNVGRVSAEKNLEALLGMACVGTKVVVGDGPALEGLRQRFPEVVFTGPMFGEELARAYRSADCFVFPSRTDTFGLVIIEALASGLPVAAYPVQGPIDLIGAEGRGSHGDLARPVGALRDDLAEAVSRALSVAPADAVAYAARFTWENATDEFVAALQWAAGGEAGDSAVDLSGVRSLPTVSAN
ncbi:MAG: glycosyltransferase family 1 protein [Novosphingobium sp.]